MYGAEESKASLLDHVQLHLRNAKVWIVGLRNQGATCYMNSLIQAPRDSRVQIENLALNTSMLMKGKDQEESRWLCSVSFVR